MRELRQYGLVYLATPYSKFDNGLEAAFRWACELAAHLIKNEISVYSPIAHTHSIARYGNLDPTDKLWYTFNHNFMHLSDALVVGTLNGWATSVGVIYERGWFAGQGKPTYYFDPQTKIVSNVPRPA